MRDILTGLAIVIILALTAALVGPHVVDWTSYRVSVDHRLSRILGAPLRSNGAISVTLLPTPSLSLEDATLGDETTSHVRVKTFEGTLNLTALLRGEIRITGMALDQPDITIVTRADGSVAGLPQVSDKFAPEKVIIERIVLHDATIRLMRQGKAPLVASHVYADGEAASLAGPFKGRSRFTLEDSRRNLSFATGLLDKGRMRVKALLEDEVRATRLDIDGTLATGGAEKDAPPLFAGQIGASGNLALPRPEGFSQVLWRLKAPIAVTTDSVSLSSIEMSIGADSQAIALTGKAELAFDPAPALSIELGAKQIDLDRALSTDPKAPVDQLPADVVRRLGAIIASSGGSAGLVAPIPAEIATEFRLDADSVIVGGDTLDGLSIMGALNRGQLTLRRASGTLPGRTQASLTGRILAAPDPGFDGRVQVATRDARRLIAWYSGVADVPLKDVEGGLTIRAAGGRLALDAVDVALDGGKVTGHLEQTPRPDGAVSAISATLRGEGLPLEMARLLQLGSARADLDLRLDLKNIRVGAAAAGRVRAHVTRSKAGLAVDEFEVADLAGLDIKGRSSLGQVGGGLYADFKAARIDGLVELARRLGYPALARGLASREGALGAISGTLRGDSRYDGGQFVNVLQVEGRAGATSIDASTRWTEPRTASLSPLETDVTFQANVKSSDSAELLAQFGLDTLPLDAGPANLDIAASGQLSKGFPLRINGRVAEAQVSLEGRVTPGAADKAFEARLSFETKDLRTPWSTMGFAFPPVAPDVSARAETKVVFAGGKLTFAGLNGRIGDNAFRGELAFDFLQNDRIAGELAFDRVDGRMLAGVALGTSTDIMDKGGWSQRRFGPAQPPPLFGDVWIETPRLSLGDGLSVEKAGFVYRFEGGFVSFERARMLTPSGWLKGSLGLRRNGQTVSAEIRSSLEGYRLPIFGDAAISGQLSGDVSASGSGDTPAGLVRSLAGGGTLGQTALQVSKLDPGALARTLDAFTVAGAQPDPEAVQERFVAEALKASLPVPAGDVTLTLAQGILRSSVLSVPGPRGAIDLSLSADLSTLKLDARAEYRESEAPKDWSGRLPAATIAWTGPLGAPHRDADTTVLSNGLAAISIARDLERIQMLEQDARERAFFMRRQRASDEERRRIEEEKRKVEEARQAEAERQREAARARLSRQPDDPDAPPPDAAPAQSTLPPLTTIPVPRLPPVTLPGDDSPAASPPPASSGSGRRPVSPPLDLRAPPGRSVTPN